MSAAGRRPSTKTLTPGERLVVVEGGGRHTGFLDGLLCMQVAAARGDVPAYDSTGVPIAGHELTLRPGEVLEVAKAAWKSPRGGTFVTVVRVVDGSHWAVWPASLRERTRHV